MRVKILCLTAFLAMASMGHAQKKIVCYFPNWAKYRSRGAKYTIGSIQANLCTHVMYSFVGINADGTIKLLDTASDLTDFTSHIHKFPGVKAIVSIGGASEGSSKFSTVVSSSTTRQRFVKNAVSFLQKYNFQGLDVDWEYPGQKGGRSSDKDNFVRLLRELKSAFSSKGYSLSAAVAAGASAASQSYDIPRISKYLDFINVMTYNFNGDWNNYIGMNAPLYPSSKDNSFQKTLNVDASIQYWLSEGAPRNKVNVGLPFYGRSYTLRNTKDHGLHAPTSGPGNAGPYTKEKGVIGYNEMCVALKNGGWHDARDREERVPYAYKGNQWVSYDDPTSIKKKCNYVKSHNLAGAMIWSIDTDDFRGNCGQKNVLLNTVNSILRG